jgi:hypothetical protein
VKISRYKDAAGTILDNTGSYQAVLYPTENAQNPVTPSVNYGVWSLDTLVKTSPWFTDTARSQYQRTDTSLTMWDSPTVGTNVNAQHPYVAQDFEAYLVVGGKVAYTIEWQVISKWAAGGNVTRTFSVSNGRITTATTDLNSFLSTPGSQLSRGTIGLGLTGQPSIANPISGLVTPPK